MFLFHRKHHWSLPFILAVLYNSNRESKIQRLYDKPITCWFFFGPIFWSFFFFFLPPTSWTLALSGLLAASLSFTSCTVPGRSLPVHTSIHLHTLIYPPFVTYVPTYVTNTYYQKSRLYEKRPAHRSPWPPIILYTKYKLECSGDDIHKLFLQFDQWYSFILLCTHRFVAQPFGPPCISFPFLSLLLFFPRGK